MIILTSILSGGARRPAGCHARGAGRRVAPVTLPATGNGARAREIEVPRRGLDRQLLA
jgi:hypothetical protein